MSDMLGVIFYEQHSMATIIEFLEAPLNLPAIPQSRRNTIDGQVNRAFHQFIVIP